ncbi:MAG: phosphoribosyltransferase [Armatimonadetes bacterium]|nr:phosphoribosyltransferase [Armatimonadota bacterium]
MQSIAKPYENRNEAGRELARHLSRYKGSDCTVLAIPRGGVVVGYEIARELAAPLDVIVPRKIPAPSQEELAIGAVVSWGDHERLIDYHTVRYLGVGEDYIEREVERQLAEVSRRLLVYRGTIEPPDVAGRTVILVDDGIATGYTTRAAVLAARKLGAGRIVLAVPVGPADSLASIEPYVDELVCPRVPSPFMAVGYWYRDFEQVTDDEVVRLLRLHATEAT